MPRYRAGSKSCAPASGRHEIAVMQTIAIDEGAGLIRLVTILAHASGEWISSDWPVCPISETASPHRLGAALTYARRYALFTLVGIAGEDDLDAPDLPAAATTLPPEEGTPQQLNGVVGSPRTQKQRSQREPALDAERSAALRDEMLQELAMLATTDDATSWAGRILKQKNRLTSADASAVEQAFEAKIASPGLSPATEDQPAQEEADASAPPRHTEVPSAQLSRAGRPPLVKTVRRRDKKHLRFVSTQPCLVCGRLPSEAHHLRFAEPRALGRKVSDEFTVPLCRGHHRELHNRGNERGWWEVLKIDPAPIAQRLWSMTR
jgi:hypothetical protein